MEDISHVLRELNDLKERVQALEEAQSTTRVVHVTPDDVHIKRVVSESLGQALRRQAGVSHVNG